MDETEGGERAGEGGLVDNWVVIDKLAKTMCDLLDYRVVDVTTPVKSEWADCATVQAQCRDPIRKRAIRKLVMEH